MIINLLQVEKLRHREAESLAQGHTADKWQSQDPIVPSTIAIFEVCGHLITV